MKARRSGCKEKIVRMDGTRCKFKGMDDYKLDKRSMGKKFVKEGDENKAPSQIQRPKIGDFFSDPTA
jgi:hypothetical protein